MTTIISHETRVQAMCCRCYDTYDGKYQDLQGFASKHAHGIISINNVFNQKENKPQIQERPVKPEISGKHICEKCNGTGFYCNGYIDGRPVSNTGFECYNCNGNGWK